MAITTVGAGTQVNTPGVWAGGPSLIQPGLPAGWAADDIAICVVGLDWGNNTTAVGTVDNMTGWDLIQTIDTAGTPSVSHAPYLYVFRRKLTSSETAPQARITGGANGTTNDLAGCARITAYRGLPGDVDTLGTIFRDNNPSGVANVGPIPGFTPAVDGAIVLLLGARSTNVASVAANAGFTSEYTCPVGVEGGFSMTLQSQIQTTKTAVSDQTLTFTGGSAGAVVGEMIALAPTAAAPSAGGRKDAPGIGAEGFWVPNQKETRLMELE